MNNILISWIQYEDVFTNVAKLLSSPGSVFNIGSSDLTISTNPLTLFHKFADCTKLESSIRARLANEFENCFVWQIHAYENLLPAPTFASPSIEWEQSIIGGHPDHPVRPIFYLSR